MKFTIPQLIAKLSLAAILMVASHGASAQGMYTMAQNANVQIKVLGKTNADQLMVATTAMESQGKFKFDGKNLADITALSFNLSAQELQPTKTPINKRAYKLLSSANPKINFKVICASVKQKEHDQYGVVLGGELTVGGVTQLKCMLLNATMNADSTITLSGHTNIQLVNDDLKSKHFMEGPLQVANDIAIQFSFTYKKDIQDTPIEMPQNMQRDYITKL